MYEGIPAQKRGRGQAKRGDDKVGKSSMKPNFDFRLTLEKQDVVGLTCNFPWIWQSASREGASAPCPQQ